MNKKFELTSETKIRFGKTLHRIKALISFGSISEGETGGWVEKEGNLAVSGDAWVYGNAEVFGNAWVFGDARVYGDARVSGDDFLSIYPIGSERGILTATVSKAGEIYMSRGCFFGSIDKFEKAVEERHSNNEYGTVYKAVVELVKAKLQPIADERKAKSEAA